METDFDFLVSLWRNYNNASALLTKFMGGTSNEVGEFAERLVAEYYDAEKLPPSNQSADLIMADNRLVQVKSRKIERLAATSLGIIRSWEFDLLVVVLFSKEGDILKAVAVDAKNAKALSKWDEHQNGHVLTTSKRLLDHPGSKDITEGLQGLLGGQRVSKPESENIPGGRREKAEQGDADAQCRLGEMYLEGRCVPQDDQVAAEWFRKSAEQGRASAQLWLGWMCSEGRGVPQDDQAAAEWFRKAAEQGHAIAQCELGWMCSEGQGVPQDDQAAAEWY
ncbi:MAG: sel1 repeat family protein, partial [Candidatus Accumulibacter sp.]|nr:sel1 repeat family protein [Accumulibacter sp.]